MVPESITLNTVVGTQHGPGGRGLIWYALSLQRAAAGRCAATQKEGINYDQTFAPVTNMSSIRAVLARAAADGWLVRREDALFVLDSWDHLHPRATACAPG